MTTVIALKTQEGDIIVGSDAQVTFGDRKSVTQGNLKVVTLNNITFIFSGTLRELNILKYGTSLPPRKTGIPPDKYIFDVAGSIRSSFVENGDLSNEADGCESAFIACFEGKIYLISYDFSILESSNKFESIGSGCDYAIGALSALIQYEENPENIITKSLEIASKYDIYTSAPFYIERIPNAVKRK